MRPFRWRCRGGSTQADGPASPTGGTCSEWSARRRALALAGAGCVALGFALMLSIPPIKHIYTASFTALAVGVSMLLYAGLYRAVVHVALLAAAVWLWRRFKGRGTSDARRDTSNIKL